jgi:hypothetical protein
MWTFIRDPYRRQLLNVVTNCHERNTVGNSLHMHLHFGLPIAFHSAMVLTLPARVVQSGQWVPDLVLQSSLLVVACSMQPRTSIIRDMMMRECARCVKEG